MSIAAFKWAKTVEGIPPLEKWLLVMIADHYNESEHKAWPGKNTLANETGMSLRTVTRCLSSLEAKGLIQIQHWINTTNGQHLNNRYFLPLHDAIAAASDQRRFVHVDPEYDRLEGRVSFIEDSFDTGRVTA